MARTPRAEYLILDIETVPDVERWARPETPEGVDPPFPPTWAHRIVVMGYLWLDHEYRLSRLGVIGDREPDGPSEDEARSTVGKGEGEGEVERARVRASRRDQDEASTVGEGEVERARVRASRRDQVERHLLESFSEIVGEKRPVLVTYNGRSFDLPVIALRSLCHAVPLGWYYRDKAVRDRRSDLGHLDLCDWLADHGAVRAGKLDALTRLIGLPGKGGVDGSQVEGLYNQGQLASIQNYCLGDVVQTALLFLRFRLLQGQLSPAGYRDATAALVDALAGDPRVTEVFGALDRDRLLPPSPAIAPA